MRKLASIQEIVSVQPIPGKDRIELAHVLGWTVIVQKGEYRPGDLTVYVEIDSVLPERPEFEFLRSKKFHIKTMKINGVTEDGVKVPVYSQGICLPQSVLGDSVNVSLPKKKLIGMDVTQTIGIMKYDEYGDDVPYTPKKYIRNQPMSRIPFVRRIQSFFGKKDKISDAFPSLVAKTDETRIQNLPHLIGRKDIHLIGREKIDGQSGTFILRKIPRSVPFMRQRYEFIVCSRNRRIPVEDNSSYWSVARKYNIERGQKILIDKYDVDWICIQGEVVGPNIQGNKYRLSGYQMFCFNLITPNQIVPCYLAEGVVGEIGLTWVPMVFEDYVMPDSVEQILSDATGKSALANVLREGVVFRNYAEGISFKAVSPDFLIKNHC